MLEQNCKSLMIVLNRLKEEKPDYHDIIFLKIFSELSYKEIGYRRPDKTYDNIRQTYRRGLLELKRMFKEIGD